MTKYNSIPHDNQIEYTERELNDKKYRVSDAIKTAEMINKSNGNGALRFATKHKERYSLVANLPIAVSQKNYLVSDILHHEKKYSQVRAVAAVQ